MLNIHEFYMFCNPQTHFNFTRAQIHKSHIIDGKNSIFNFIQVGIFEISHKIDIDLGFFAQNLIIYNHL